MTIDVPYTIGQFVLTGPSDANFTKLSDVTFHRVGNIVGYHITAGDDGNYDVQVIVQGYKQNWNLTFGSYQIRALTVSEIEEVQMYYAQQWVDEEI